MISPPLNQARKRVNACQKRVMAEKKKEQREKQRLIYERVRRFVLLLGMCSLLRSFSAFSGPKMAP